MVAISKGPCSQFMLTIFSMKMACRIVVAEHLAYGDFAVSCYEEWGILGWFDVVYIRASRHHFPEFVPDRVGGEISYDFAQCLGFKSV
jgi:hypothetical protein